MFLKISQDWQENTCAGVFFSIRLQVRGLKRYLKSWSDFEFCEVFKNTFFIYHLQWLLLKKICCKKSSAKLPGKQCLYPATLSKETPTKLFSCEFCEIFQNRFFIEHLRTIDSHVTKEQVCNYLAAWRRLKILQRKLNKITESIIWNPFL